MYLSQGLKRAALLFADKIGTICDDRVRTWSQVLDRVKRAASGLDKLGLSDGDRVAMLALNSDWYFEYYFALPWVGAVAVPINIRLAPPEMAFWLNDSQSKALFIDDAFLGLLDELKLLLETVEHYVYIGARATPEGMISYEDLIRDNEPMEEDKGYGYDDLAALCYTGGTTGRSKGVMLSHRNLLVNAFNTIPGINLRTDTRWLTVAPMFHAGGTFATIGVTMLGGTHIFVPAFDPVVVLKSIEEHKVTDTLLVPTMVNMVINHPDIGKYDVSSLETLNYGASPMPETVIRRAIELMPGCGMVHLYGQTETAPLISMNGKGAHRGKGLEKGLFKSTGNPMLGVEVKIADEDDNELPPNQVGQLLARGGNVMKGYWNLEEQTREALRGGWMHTGDAAYMTEDGYIYIVDRVKDMIISGGENVYSAEVENAIGLHPAVLESAVIGVPDSKWGERVHGIVRLHEGKAASAEEIMEHCHKLIAGFKCPRSITFREEPLPLSGAGKILKKDLRKPYWEGRDQQVG